MSRPIVLGICAMPKKASCKPMQEIINNLSSKEFQIVVFDEDVLFGDPIEKWPICDALICFYSNGFPQERAEKYVELRKPFLVNDLHAQRWLRDRRKVFQLCERNGIPVPNYIAVSRDGDPEWDQNADRLIEEDDYLEIDGKRITKPFVEKPVDADAHNVFVYYPRASGGGRKELFRKIGDRCSEFYPDRDRVRRDGSYVYEEFLATEGTDVKVYAVTGAYANAEARKSPTMDGRVVRDENQLEVRYPVTLSISEKEIAARICDVFKQRVCGFDMLRCKGKTFICDVNGWSFVKRNTRHLKDSATILGRVIKTGLSRYDLMSRDDDESINDSEENDPDLPKAVPSTPRGKRHEELRAVIAVVRHGDRTPKQKLKIKTNQKRFIDLIPAGKSEVKLKTANDLSTIQTIINDLLEEMPPRATTPLTPSASVDRLSAPSDSPRNSPSQDDEETEELLLQARAVLEIGGSFKGINRKVQLKVTRTEVDPVSKKEVPVEVTVIIKWGGVLTGNGRRNAEQLGRSFRERLYPGVDGLLRLHSTYRHDLKIYASDEGRVQVSAASFAKGLLDLEGHLTPLLTSLVWKGDDVNLFLDDASGALEELERAKVEIRLSLGLEAVPLAKSLSRSYSSGGHDSNGDDQGAASERRLNGAGSTEPVASVKNAKEALGNDVIKAMEELNESVNALKVQIKTIVKQIRHRPSRGTEVAAALKPRKINRVPSESSIKTGDGVSEGGSAAASLGDLLSSQLVSDRGDGAKTFSDMIQLSYARWEKLAKDFYKVKSRTFDVSKIPDMYDSAKYDVTHNPELLKLEPFHLHRVYFLSKKLADIVVPQEYGSTSFDKFYLGAKLARRLALKIVGDLRNAAAFQGQEAQHRLDTRFAKELGIKSTDRHVLTRVYFTSESHMHSILNILRFAHVFEPKVRSPPPEILKTMENIEELDYLSHLVLRLYEVTAEDGSTGFQVRVAFSPGVTAEVTYNPTSGQITNVQVGKQETSQEKEVANQHIKKHNHLVSQLPPAAPLIKLWDDLSLDAVAAILSTVEQV